MPEVWYSYCQKCIGERQPQNKFSLASDPTDNSWETQVLQSPPPGSTYFILQTAANLGFFLKLVSISRVQ